MAVQGPVQPVVLREALPVSPSLLVDGGYGDALAGYVRGAMGELAGASGPAAQGYLAALAEDPDNMVLRSRVFETALLEGDVTTAIRLARAMPAQPVARVEGKQAQGSAMPALVRVVGSLHDGNLPQARSDVAVLVRQAPELVQFKLLEAYVAIAQGEPVAKQAAMLAAMPVPQPLEARKQYHIARMWQGVGDEARMLEALELSNRLEPGALFTTLMLADVKARMGNMDEAQGLVRVFRDKNAHVALLEDEMVRLQGGHLGSVFAPNLKHNAAMTLFDFGLLVWSQGAVMPARQIMNQALYLDPANPYILYYAGIVDESAKAFGAATVKYGAIDKASPVGLAARIKLAEAVFRDGDKDRAMAMAKGLVRERPTVQAAQRSLAEMAFDGRDYATALEAYDNLLKTHAATSTATTPASVLAAMYFARGASYERLGDYGKAADDLSLSLIINPTNPSVLNYLAYMWVEQGRNMPESVLMLERAHEAAPDDGAIMDSLGWAYYRQGNYAKALPLLEQAADATPDDATVYLHLGDCYAKVGNVVSAQRYWRLAKTLLTSDDDVAVRRAIEGRVR